MSVCVRERVREIIDKDKVESTLWSSLKDGWNKRLNSTEITNRGEKKMEISCDVLVRVNLGGKIVKEEKKKSPSRRSTCHKKENQIGM